ncbi:MAG: hypothetical protein ACK55Z_02540, partial [bacterium]
VRGENKTMDLHAQSLHSSTGRGRGVRVTRWVTKTHLIKTYNASVCVVHYFDANDASVGIKDTTSQLQCWVE